MSSAAPDDGERWSLTVEPFVRFHPTRVGRSIPTTKGSSTGLALAEEPAIWPDAAWAGDHTIAPK